MWIRITFLCALVLSAIRLFGRFETHLHKVVVLLNVSLTPHGATGLYFYPLGTASSGYSFLEPFHLCLHRGCQRFHGHTTRKYLTFSALSSRKASSSISTPVPSLLSSDSGTSTGASRLVPRESCIGGGAIPSATSRSIKDI